MAFDFDLIVIGAGSAGVRASRMAAAQGKKVAVIEERYLGGTCVNVGCVPKKLFVYASEFRHQVEDGRGFGVDMQLNSFDWPTLRDNKTKEIQRLNGIYANLLKNSGVQIIEGHGRVVAANTIEVNQQHFTARQILIATGGWPDIPDIPGRELCIDSNQVFFLERFPRHIVIVGGGYIAVEFAGIFAGLGAKVSLVCRSGKLLKGFDEETRAYAQQEILKNSIDFIASEQPAAVRGLNGAEGELRLEFTSGAHVDGDCILFATGRKPNVQGAFADGLLPAMDNEGHLLVNDRFETSMPGVFAMGDITPGLKLTPVALAEAMCFVRQQYQGVDTPMDYANIPTAVFSQPELASVGLSEEAARDEGFQVSIFTSEFRALKNTLSGNAGRTFMKLVVDKNTDRVLGVHMVGEHAGEILQGFAVALKAGATKAVFDSTIGIHPSAAEEFVTMRTATR
ncbi:MAG: glutathione-disulfide reductase [Oceanospirillaceae bacterium]|nr:glutathione-disulfide reductase [Oceanospirillaceae bacterium]MCP5349389.1 glutathione-disulfide reductase [Oceanospirillaceae bacterium]